MKVVFMPHFPMRRLLISLVAVFASAGSVFAIPNTITGNLNQVNSPLNGEDLTNQLLAEGVWDGSVSLPGEWRAESVVAEASTSYLLARPKVLGEDVVLLRAVHRGEVLDSLEVTFADAGSYFQYEPRVTKEQLEARRRALAEKQERFAGMYQERLERVRALLEKMGESKVKKLKQGAARLLRAESEVFSKGGLKLVLLADGHRMIRLTICREVKYRKSWLDDLRQEMGERGRAAYYRKQVQKLANGDVVVDGVRVVPQGYKPYCGVNTLVMAAHYFGLHVDEDWLAVAGKFQNTGSAGNSNMLGLYNAVAKEARLKLARETKFDFRKARSLLRDGMPVVVWRRFDYERNALHTRVSRMFERDGVTKFPKLEAGERASWPGKKHPVHASVIVGYNDERKEVLFLESWKGMTKPRRMRYEEMEATATWAFYFRGN